MTGYYDDGNFFKRLLAYILLICLIVAFFVMWTSCTSAKPSKHQNDSVADRLRQRHAPVRLHNPKIK